MALTNTIGAGLTPDNGEIISNIPIACPNGTHAAAAGTIVKQKNGDFYGILMDDITADEGDATERGLQCGTENVNYKTHAGSGKAIANGAELTLIANPDTATDNNYFWQTCTDGDPIHGLAKEAALTGDTTVRVLGPFKAPYQLAVVAS